MKKSSTMSVRTLSVTGVLTAVAYVLYILGFKIPFVPIVTMDFSDLPAVIAALAYGPVFGVIICALKNVLHLVISHTMWIGELSNFILGATYVLVASLIYMRNKTKKNAVIALLISTVVTSLVGVVSNYFLIYPLYIKLCGFSMEMIIGMYQAQLSFIDSLLPALVIFNVPFTIVKELVCTLGAIYVYKPLSRFIKGNQYA